MPIELDRDYWWPTSPDPREIGRRAKRIRDARAAAEMIVERARYLDVCVQAGGHVGLWPLQLSLAFQFVMTFEADATNYRCLSLNLKRWEGGDVAAHHAALSDSAGTGRVLRTKAHEHLSGAGYVVDGGDVPRITIDAMVNDLPVGAIVLDIEGGEYRALKGAHWTLEHHHPLVVVEAGPWPRERPGVQPLAVTEALLARYGYGPPKKFPLGAWNYYFSPVD